MDKVSVLILCLFGLPFACIAQGRFPYVQYKKGISQVQITCIKEDPKTGNIWVGTKEGINVFHTNTGEFENSEQNPQMTNLPIRDIQKDRQGNIWYSNPEGFFCENGKSITDPKWKQKGIYTLFRFDKKNQLFVKLYGLEKIYIWKNNKMTSLNEIYPTLPQRLTQILWNEDKSKVILVGDSMLYSLAEKLDSIPIPRILLKEQKKYGLYFVESNQKIYGANNKGVFDIEADSFIFRITTGEIQRTENSVQVNKTGNVYFIQDNHLMKYDKTTRVTIDFGKAFNLPASILLTHNHHIYLGSEEGLIKYTGEKFTFYSKEDNILNPWAVVTEKNGTVWCGDYGHGLFRLNPEKKVFEEVIDYQKLDINIQKNKYFYFGAIRDHKDNLLFPHAGFGVLKYDGNGLSNLNKKGFSILNKDSTFITMAILDDTISSRYLIGARRLYSMDYTGKCTLYGGDTVITTYQTAITKDKKGTYWIGGFRQLARWGGKGTLKKVVPYRNAKIAGLSLHTDYKGTVWVGNGLSGGLWYYDGNKEDEFKQVLAKHCKKTVYFIQSIDSSYLLIGGGDGLYVLDLQLFYNKYKHEEYAAKYDDDNGMLIGSECGQNGIHKANDSLFYFVTNEAIMRLNVTKFKQETQRICWEIDTIRASGTSYLLDRIKVDFGNNTFHYFHDDIELFFSKNDNTNYAFRYELQSLKYGRETHYGRNITNYELMLKNLPADKYRLVVYAELGYEGFVDTAPFVIEFEVLAWWRFWIWFIIPVIVIVIVISRFKRLRRKGEISERERELAAYQLKNIAMHLDPHFFHNALYSLKGLINWETREDKDKTHTVIDVLSSSMQSLLQSDSPFWTLKEELIFIENFLKIEKIRYPFSYESIISVAIFEQQADIILPKTFIQATIQNAITYGARCYSDGREKVVLHIEHKDTHIIISVIDNGMGLEHGKKMKRGNRKGISIIKKIFINLNKYEQSYPFSHEIGDRINATGEIEGVYVKIIIPSHFIYPTLTL